MIELLSYFVDPFLLQGALIALEISAVALVLGLFLGLGLALARLSSFAPLRAAAWFYIWFVRGTPQLLQLVFIYDALPPFGIKLDIFSTAVIGFALNEAAFGAEIIRGGILSVNRNQLTAASAFGMSYLTTLRRIVLPQAMRAIVPGIANDAISLIKSTSIASVIFVNELTFRAQQIVGQNFRFFTVFAAAGLIYLVMTSAVAIVQSYLERRFDYVSDKNTNGSALQRFFGVAPAFLRRPRTSAPVPAGVRAAPPPAVVRGQALSQLIGGGSKREASPDDDSFLVLRNVWKSYGEREILRGVDLTVRRGEVIGIMGPSGSGKSTLLRLINHLESIDWGEITLDRALVGYAKQGDLLKPVRNLARARAQAKIGMVFQHFDLFEHLTAVQNIMEAPVHVHGGDPDECRVTATRLLAAVGLADRADVLPHRLSGGQQQRVAIARALAISPRLMLFDEPTSALDPELVGDVLAVIRELAGAGMTMIVVTHEIRFARDVADRVVFMADGQIVEEGPPAEVLENPKRERTRQFLRSVAGAEKDNGAENP